MALIVEDGTGLPNAESYESVAGADTYHVAYGNAAWAAASSPQKEAALRQATQYIGATYSQSWMGRRKTSTQALDWPRRDVTTIDSYRVSSSIVPTPIKSATSYLALRALSETLMPDEADDGVSYERKKLGPLEKETHFAGGKSEAKAYELAERLIAPFVYDLDMGVRG